MKRFVVLVALLSASAGISMWRPAPGTPQSAVAAAHLLVPPIFTRAGAAGPVVVNGDNGCKTTPDPGNGGQLSITLKKISIIDTNNNQTDLLVNDSTLDFAKNQGATVGDFVANAAAPNGTYNKMKVTIGGTLTINCSVMCNPGDGGGTRTFYTPAGLTPIRTKDGNTGPAQAETIAISNSDTTSTVDIVPALVIANNSAGTLSIFFSSLSACQLNDVSSLNGHPALTDLKILPALPAPTKVQ